MEYLKDGKISAGHARALLTLENEELMTELADEIVAKDLSIRQVEKICKKKPTVQKEEKHEKKIIEFTGLCGNGREYADWLRRRE